MTPNPEWVIVLAIQPTTGRWLMVYHQERRWELPGGKIQEGESIEDAALRELKEEANISGQVVDSILLDTLELGIVVFVKIDDNDSRDQWTSKDPKIKLVSYHHEIPDNLHWGSYELKKILDHWSASSTKPS